MRITVTEEHIRKGERCLPRHCPIALAIKDATGMEASVGPIDMDLYKPNDNRGTNVELPREACRFVNAFDRKVKVKPFSFDLPLDESAAHPQVDESH